MTRDGRARPPHESRLLRGSGLLLLLTAVFLAVTRSQVSETLIGTLLAFSVVLLGVTLPKDFLGTINGRKDDD